MNDFLLGAFAMGSAAVALFFVRYYRASRDRIFLIFALAFAALALERLGLEFVAPQQEGRHWIFLLRLAAFLLIIVGVLDKNRGVWRRRSHTRARPSAGATVQ